jgi:hypothetical protein
LTPQSFLDGVDKNFS